jgi:hypothetical protein
MTAPVELRFSWEEKKLAERTAAKTRGVRLLPRDTVAAPAAEQPTVRVRALRGACGQA